MIVALTDNTLWKIMVTWTSALRFMRQTNLEVRETASLSHPPRKILAQAPMKSTPQALWITPCIRLWAKRVPSIRVHLQETRPLIRLSWWIQLSLRVESLGELAVPLRTLTTVPCRIMIRAVTTQDSNLAPTFRRLLTRHSSNRSYRPNPTVRYRDLPNHYLEGLLNPRMKRLVMAG